MKHKLLGTFAIASLGAAMALAVPATAAPKGGGGTVGGHVSAAPMARSSGTANFSGNARFGSSQFTTNNTARFNGRPGNNFVANNSYARANGNWSGNWSGRHHRHRGGGFAAGVGLGLAYGAYGYGYCDPYLYDCGDGYDYGPSYAYDEGYDTYDTYAAAPEYAGGSVQYCMQRFRSYDLSTRTYLATDGLRHSCP
jgi:hypothetical protein